MPDNNDTRLSSRPGKCAHIILAASPSFRRPMHAKPLQIKPLEAALQLWVTAAALSCCVLAAAQPTATSSTFPNKTIRIYTAEPGGGADLQSRLIAQGFTA